MNESISHLQMPSVALIGRPNVGKSTLFNRLVGFRQAVVSDQSGTTRDRIFGQVEWNGRVFQLIDAGGYDESQTDSLSQSVQQHLAKAWNEGDILLFVLDAQQGVLQDDLTILERMRKLGKPIVVVVNKCDGRPDVPVDFHQLGLEKLYPISATHGLGIGDVLDDVIGKLPGELPRPLPKDNKPSIAIVGRPNVGKSSIFNALLQEDRVIVSDVPGTTRDAVDTLLTLHGQEIRLIDTAGLRQRRKIKSPIDIFSMFRTEKSIVRADVALVVLDATENVTRDDHRILNRVIDERRGCVIVLNKWDLIDDSNQRELIRKVQEELPYALFAPILVTSAVTGFGIFRAVEKALRVCYAMRTKLERERVLELLNEAWEEQPPPRYRGRNLKLTKARWIENAPILELTTSPIGKLPTSYQQFLLKRLHTDPELDGVPVRLSIIVPEEDHARREKKLVLKHLRRKAR